jgi:hypothetical protein
MCRSVTVKSVEPYGRGAVSLQIDFETPLEVAGVVVAVADEHRHRRFHVRTALTRLDLGGYLAVFRTDQEGANACEGQTALRASKAAGLRAASTSILAPSP